MKQAVYDIATPYTAAYMIFRRGNQIAFLLRQNTNWMNGYYGLPAGKVDKGESALRAAIRETKEEVGVVVEPKDLKHLLTVHRDGHDSLWVDLVFEVKKWQGELRNAEPHLHEKLDWLEPDKLPDNVIPNVRFILEQIQAGKTYAEFGWKLHG